MDAFLIKFFSVVFKVLIVSSVLILITGTFRRLVINKTIKAIIELPDEKKEKLIHIQKSVVSMYRIFFWMAPLYLLVIPVTLFVIPTLLPVSEHDLLHQLFLADIVGSFGIYIYMLDDFFYKKKILKALENSSATH